MTDDNLANVFDDSNDAAEIEAETKETEGEKEAEVKTEAKEAETPAAENKEEVWTKKRQALESELEQLKKTKPKDGEQSEPEQISLEDRLWQERTQIHQEMCREKYEDYDEMETLFLDMCKENPALKVELRNAPNGPKFVYNQAKNHNEAKKLSDPDYVQKMREEIRKEVLAEIEGKQSPGDKRKKSALSVAALSNATHTDSNSSKAKLSSLDDMFD